MQKKVLASLLVTPLAFNAFANITVNENLAGNGENWNQTGISGANPFQQGGIVCPIGSGVLTMDLGELNPGKYVLKFTDAKNVRATVSDGVNSKSSNGENLEFTVDAVSKWTLTLTGANQAEEFHLSGISFEIDFEVEDVKNALKEALKEVVTNSVAEGDNADEAKKLREEQTALDKRKSDLQAEIEGLKETIEDYDKNQLWKDDNVIKGKIDALAKDVEDYNGRVKAENDKYDLGVANEQAKKQLLDLIDAPETGLDALLKAQTDRYNETNMKDADERAYVSKTNEGTAAGIQGEITTFKLAIEKAYENIYDPEIKAPEDKSEVIKARITALDSQITATIADWNVYKKLMELQSKLTAETSTTLEALSAKEYKGAEGMNKSFDAYVAAQEAEVRKTYSDALANVATKRLENPNVPGALDGVSQNQAGDSEILTTANDKIKGFLSAAVAAQETYWKNVETVNGEAKKLADPEVVPALPEGLPEEEVAKYDALKKAAEDAVNALKTQVDNQYDATLDTSAATAAFTAVKDFVTAWQPVIGLINDLNDLKAHIEKLQADSKVPVSEFDLMGKFAGTITSLDEAIKAIYVDNQPPFDGDKITDVKTAIEERKGFADTLMESYVDASKSVGEFQKLVDGLNKNIEDKLIVADNSKPAAFKETDTYKKLKEKLDQVTKDLLTVRSTETSPQVSYETAETLKGNVEGYPALVAAAVHEFEKTYTGNNKTTVSTALEELEAYAAEGEYYGKTTDFSALQTELDGIAAKIAAADALADDAKDLVKTYSDIDTELQALYNKISDKKADVKALKDNQAAYEELLGLVPETDVIKALWDYNDANSDAPAKGYYADQVIGHETPVPATGFYEKRESLISELELARTAEKPEDNAYNKKQALQDKITAFKNEIEQTYKDIYANNANYAAQNVESARVREYIDDLIDEIKVKKEESGTFDGDNPLNEAFNTWINTLTSLRDNDLNNEDLVANGYYGKGQSASKNDEVKNEYKRIEDAAKAIETDFNDNFFNKVKETNAQTMAEANWDAAYSYTDKVYRQSIETYNSFFQLNNPYYSQYILTVVQTHRDIYEYSKLITNLKAEVDAEVAKYNEDGDVFTLDKFKEFSVDKANALINEMEAKVKKMMDQCNEAAKNYYYGKDSEVTVIGNDGVTKTIPVKFEEGATSYPEANETIEKAKETLANAGVNLTNASSALKVAEGHLNSAVDVFTANETNSLLALDFMNGVANDLDAVAGSIDLDAAAVAQWKENYAYASESLEALKEKLEKCTSEGDESRAQLAAYIDQACGLNVQATDIENLASKTSKLQVILDAAEGLVGKKQTEYDNDQANKQLAADFQKRLDQLMADYYALVQYVGSITAEVPNSINNINKAIEDVKGELEKDKASLVANKEKIENLFVTAENQISGAYGLAQQREIQALYDLLAKTKVAFNNAKVYSTTLTDEEKASYNDQIDNIEKGENGIEKLIQLYSVYTKSKVSVEEKAAALAEFLTNAKSIESELSDIYVKLESSYKAEFEGENIGGDPVPGIIAELTEQYVALESELTDAAVAYNRYVESVQKKYPDGYNNLMESLEAVKELWEADGNKVVLNADTYKNDMWAIRDNFEDLRDKMEAANKAALEKQAAMEANNAAYERLDAELTGYVEQLEAIAELAGEYDLVTSYKQNFDILGNRIEDARVWLAEEHSRCQLNENSVLVYPYNTISTDLLYLSIDIENSHVYDVRRNTWGIINGAYSIFSDNTVVPEIKDEQLPVLNGLAEEMSAIATEHSNLVNGFSSGKISAEQFVEGCHKLDERCQEICAKAEAVQTVARENIFFKGDVNDNPDGIVNATDLQMIIGWILDGTTYQQLYEASPVQAAAADLTGDKDINIADATDEVELILNQDNGVEISKVAPRMARNGVRTSGNTFALAMLSSENGERDYALTLNNGDTFIAGQFDVKLPVGMSIKDVKLDARAANHEVMFADNGNGNYRIVIISMTNEAIQGNDGVLLHIITEGIGNPTLSNGIFADEEHAPVRVNTGNTSVVDTIHNGAVNMKERIYDAAGRTLRAVQRGINIIRKSDGTTTKEYHK